MFSTLTSSTASSSSSPAHKQQLQHQQQPQPHHDSNHVASASTFSRHHRDPSALRSLLTGFAQLQSKGVGLDMALKSACWTLRLVSALSEKKKDIVSSSSGGGGEGFETQIGNFLERFGQLGVGMFEDEDRRVWANQLVSAIIDERMMFNLWKWMSTARNAIQTARLGKDQQIPFLSSLLGGGGGAAAAVAGADGSSSSRRVVAGGGEALKALLPPKITVMGASPLPPALHSAGDNNNSSNQNSNTTTGHAQSSSSSSSNGISDATIATTIAATPTHRTDALVEGGGLLGVASSALTPSQQEYQQYQQQQQQQHSSSAFSAMTASPVVHDIASPAYTALTATQKKRLLHLPPILKEDDDNDKNAGVGAAAVSTDLPSPSASPLSATTTTMLTKAFDDVRTPTTTAATEENVRNNNTKTDKVVDTITTSPPAAAPPVAAPPAPVAAVVSRIDQLQWFFTFLTYFLRTFEQGQGDVGFWNRFWFTNWDSKKHSRRYKFFKSLTLTASIILETIKIIDFKRRLAEAEALHRPPQSVAATPIGGSPSFDHPIGVTDLKQKLRKSLLLWVRTLGDMFIYFQWIESYKPNKVLCSLCGMYSGLVGVYLVWTDNRDAERKRLKGLRLAEANRAAKKAN